MNKYNLKSLDDIMAMKITKGKLFEGMKEEFDCALPQDWLNEFSDWCRIYLADLTYNEIRSTTVWTADGMTTCCQEVFDAYQVYQNSKRIEAKVSSMVNRLGGTSEEVAKFLLKQKAKGLRNFSHCCVISRFLKKSFKLTFFTYEGKVQVSSPKARFEMQLPQPVCDFVTDFDCGKYPELVD